MIRWIINWYDARRRQIDIEVLWPVCKNQCTHIEDARRLFYHHAVNDVSWIKHFTAQQIIEQIEALP